MSQCDQLAALLSDGEWHSTRNLLREVPCIVHSRISDLRKRGLIIEHQTLGSGAAGSLYRLVQIGAGPEAESDGAATVHPQARTADGESAASLVTENVASALTPAAAGTPVLPTAAGDQLTLEDVAA